MPTIRITYIDSVTPGVLGTKIYRDDIEIADVANGVQTYDDTTALEATTYKYEVQAYTSSGESTDEVIGVNVENITTSGGIIDLYPTGNAASVGTEADNIGDWINQNVLTSTSTDSIDGSWSIEAVSIGVSAYSRCELNLTLDDASDYIVTIWAKRGVNTESRQAFDEWVGFVATPSSFLSSDNWTEYVFNVTTNSPNQIIKTYSTLAGTVSSNDSILIDKITIIKV